MEKTSTKKIDLKDSIGSSESQISIFTKRIKNLTEHLKSNKKDHNN
jgi:Ribosomal protein S15P/S13E